MVAGRFLSAIIFVSGISCVRSTTYTHPSVDLSSENDPSLGSLEICDSKETDEWFSRISFDEDMSNPVMSYRYCYYEMTRTKSGKCQRCYASYCYDNRYETLSFADELTCGEKVFTKKVGDGEIFRAFYDDYGNGTPDHAAVGFSDAGTVCFYHYQWNYVQGTAQRCGSGSGSGSCEITCFGISDDEDEKHYVALKDYDRGKQPFWVVEVSFSKKGSSSGSIVPTSGGLRSATTTKSLTFIIVVGGLLAAAVL